VSKPPPKPDEADGPSAATLYEDVCGTVGGEVLRQALALGLDMGAATVLQMQVRDGIAQALRPVEALLVRGLSDLRREQALRLRKWKPPTAAEREIVARLGTSRPRPFHAVRQVLWDAMVELPKDDPQREAVNELYKVARRSTSSLLELIERVRRDDELQAEQRSVEALRQRVDALKSTPQRDD
jgi:hypothetical protein